MYSDYELIACPCAHDCWCKRNACAGHYRIKDITFESFLESYLELCILRNSRQNVKRAVLNGREFKGWQRNAVAPLKKLRETWSSVLNEVRRYDKCGLCDAGVLPLACAVTNLYVGKIRSQLFYDSIVPFDTKSKAKTKSAGYTDPARDFLAMNRELFADLRRHPDAHRLGVPGLRGLDSPGMIDPQLPEPAGGQPLSRVIDKIFYQP